LNLTRFAPTVSILYSPPLVSPLGAVPTRVVNVTIALFANPLFSKYIVLHAGISVALIIIEFAVVKDSPILAPPGDDVKDKLVLEVIVCG